MSSVTVIGATSPLGVSLVPAFAAAGRAVAATYRDASSIPNHWVANESVTPLELDLRTDRPEIAAISDVIVWLSHLDAGRFNDAEVELNRAALLRFLDAVDPAETRSFIFISSGGSVYGPAVALPIDENHPRVPLSSYGMAKRAMEDELIRFGERTGVRTAILRPGNIYGFERPDRKCKGVTAAFLNAVDHKLPFTLIHGGRTVRDFVHVDDVCSAVLLAAETEDQQVIWNVGTGVGTSTIELIEALQAESAVAMPELIEKENFTSDVLENVLSYRRIHEAAGWSPTIAFHEGVKRTVAHWREFRDAAVAGQGRSRDL